MGFVRPYNPKFRVFRYWLKGLTRICEVKQPTTDAAIALLTSKYGDQLVKVEEWLADKEQYIHIYPKRTPRAAKPKPTFPKKRQCMFRS